MTSTQQRQTLLPLIVQAVRDGARLKQACMQIGLSTRTVQRWQRPCAVDGDRRVNTLRAKVEPPNKLSASEREAAMQVLNSEEFKDLPPSQIVPRLADQGVYLASESTLYRLLHAQDQMGHRRLERAPRKASKPRALVATQPDQVYCWDITYLPAPVRGSIWYRSDYAARNVAIRAARLSSKSGGQVSGSAGGNSRTGRSARTADPSAVISAGCFSATNAAAQS